MTSHQISRIITFGALFIILIAGSVLYDRWIAAVSKTRATLSGRYEKCGPPAMSGPREPEGTRTLKRYFVMARLDDGSLVRVSRVANPLPHCGAALKIEERVTPWGSVWYWTDQ